MKTNASAAVKAWLESETPRKIVARTRGRGHGITRMVSPSDIGQLIKPFVFLDHVDIEPKASADLPEFLADYYHPHSGLATVTLLFSGEIYYEDTSGANGTLPSGGIEYMQAGGGVWHTGSAIGSENTRGFQLWVALPPELENAPAKCLYLLPSDIAQVGPARVVLGSYEGVQSKIPSPSDLTYLHVELKAGQRWDYLPPAGHNVAWVALYTGQMETSGETLEKEVAVFSEGPGALHFIAKNDVTFVLGSAIKHPHPLVLGYYSVHTSRQALELGEAGIRKLEQTILPERINGLQRGKIKP